MQEKGEQDMSGLGTELLHAGVLLVAVLRATSAGRSGHQPLCYLALCRVAINYVGHCTYPLACICGSGVS